LAQDLEQYIDHFYRQITGGEDLASAFDEDVTTGDVAADDTLEADLSEQDSEVVRMVNALLVEAWRKNVSDIHIEPNPFSRYCLIRFRIDGTCHEFRKVRLALARPIVSRLKIMAHLDIAERRLPQDGKIKIKLPDRNQVVEYRMATIPTIENQEDVVLRVLASGKPLPLDKLGLLPRNQAAFEGMIRKPYGLILVVGPTGSGKTTTLHSAVSYINTPERKIWTAEDPVEITQEGLRQVQVQPKIGLTFAAVLRSFLRADPDVIMIGEMRDKETAHIGVEASLTGHLVFSTLHTNSAPETVTRLLDMDLDPFNFADSLLCVLAQRLVKTLCPHCKEAYPASEQEIEDLRMEFGPGFDVHAAEFLASERTLYRKVGCAQCMGSGYKGRVGIHELMLSSEGIKTSIKYRKPTEEIRSQAVADGMLSLKQDGILKVLQGRTDMEQVRAVAG
jgi:type II secretory ATPase GspE/PulE/Tfp pilus assembly ATPase PilB-like protein